MSYNYFIVNNYAIICGNNFVKANIKYCTNYIIKSSVADKVIKIYSR